MQSLSEGNQHSPAVFLTLTSELLPFDSVTISCTPSKRNSFSTSFLFNPVRYLSEHGPITLLRYLSEHGLITLLRYLSEHGPITLLRYLSEHGINFILVLNSRAQFMRVKIWDNPPREERTQPSGDNGRVQPLCPFLLFPNQ